jgi:transposase
MSGSRAIRSTTKLDHKSSFHRFIKPNLGKISLYSDLYFEICRYHQKAFDLKFSELKFDGTDKLQRTIKYTEVSIETNLTGQFKNQICTQIADELNSLIKTFNYWYNRSLTDKSERTLSRLEHSKTNPTFDNFELRFCFANIEFNNGLSYLQLNACGSYGMNHPVKFFPKAMNLRLPFKFPKYFNKFLIDGWKRSTSVTLCKDGFRINYEKEIPANDSKIIIGCDQGINNCISLAASDGTTFQSVKEDIHGHSLGSIQAKLARKQKGSKAYRRAQEHRKNFINARLNEAKTFIKKAGSVNLEDLRYCGRGRNSGSFLSKFEHSRIRSKLGQICNEQGLQLHLSANAYKSRRCSSCGWVDKANRSGKQFKCTKCGFEDDADLNAAKNHLLSLPKLYPGAGNLFYWQTSGASLVPDARKTK